MERPSYFRRCHVCGELNHLSETHDGSHCEFCSKAMARFHYFDDRLSPIQSDRTLRPPLLEGEYPPLQGLTVYWDM